MIMCCSQECFYYHFLWPGRAGERFSKLDRVWTASFEAAFVNYFTTMLRNIAQFFQPSTGTNPVDGFECVKVNEDDTTPSSRIFLKIFMNEMVESTGLKTLAERFKDPEVKRGCEGMFSMDVPKNTRFAINYFASIGLGVYVRVSQGTNSRSAPSPPMSKLQLTDPPLFRTHRG